MNTATIYLHQKYVERVSIGDIVREFTRMNMSVSNHGKYFVVYPEKPVTRLRLERPSLFWFWGRS